MNGDGNAVRLLLALAPEEARAPLTVLLAIDTRLGTIASSAREPLIGQMRLTWWYEALVALDGAPPPAEPLLRDTAATLLPRGVSGVELASIATGWEATLASPVDVAALGIHAADRGATVFALAARLLDQSGVPLEAGEAWALADLARRGVATTAAAALAEQRAAVAFAQRWPRASRPLGQAALLAIADLSPAHRASMAWRSLWFGLTGR